MDEVARTAEVYESDAASYAEKYLAESIAARYGDAFLDALEGPRVLDVGCGPGADLETFAGAGYDAVGLDVTPAFLRRAAERAPVVRGDMRHLPFRDGSFDGVWSSASLLHVPRADVPGTLREFHRVLAPGGVAFVSAKSGEPAGRDPDERHVEYYDPAEIRTLLEGTGFDPETVRTDDNWVSAIARGP